MNQLRGWAGLGQSSPAGSGREAAGRARCARDCAGASVLRGQGKGKGGRDQRPRMVRWAHAWHHLLPRRSLRVFFMKCRCHPELSGK